MAGKRTLKVAGEKIARERANLKLDQESFARTANVSVRTLQRAEKSGMITRVKINQIAKVLEINPEELIDDNVSEESLDTRNDGYGTLILEPVRSYKELWKTLTRSLEWLDVKYDISPNPDLVQKVANIIETVQVRVNDDRSGITEAMKDTGEPPDYVRQFKKDMEISKTLLDLWDGGISVFAGQYTHRSLTYQNVKVLRSRNQDEYNEGIESEMEILAWFPHSTTLAVLRFFDDKDVRQKNNISINIFYGLSRSVSDKWAYCEGDGIRADSTEHTITADNQISPPSDVVFAEDVIPTF